MKPWLLVDLELTPPSARGFSSRQAVFGHVRGRRTNIVTVGQDGRVHYIDVETGIIQWSLDLEPAGLETVQVDSAAESTVHGGGGRSGCRGPGHGMGRPNSEWCIHHLSPMDRRRNQPDGSTIVLGHADGRIELVDLDSGGRRVPVPSSLDDGLVDLAWSTDGTMFAGATSSAIMIWNAALCRQRPSFAAIQVL